MSDLVKRLREYRIGCGIHCSHYDAGEPLDECIEAANYIDALEAENKALREALKDTLRSLEYWYRPAVDEPTMPGSVIGVARALLAKENT